MTFFTGGHGVNPRRVWNEDKERALIEMTQNGEASLDKMALRLGVTHSFLQRKMKSLGLRQSQKEFWTPVRLDILKSKWEQGATATEIGELLGCSRSAVLGKKHRLGLSMRTDKEISRAAKAAKAAKRTSLGVERSKRVSVPRPTKRLPPMIVELNQIDPANPGISIMELKTDSCRAVIGKGEDGMARYCGATSFPSRSFCPAHCALYYRPLDSRE